MNKDFVFYQFNKASGKLKKLIFLWLIAGTLVSAQDTYPETVLTFERMDTVKTLFLKSNWVFNTGDNKAWAAPDFNDSNWQKIETDLMPGQFDSLNWEGIGWFRLNLIVDSALSVENTGYSLVCNGAAEIYLNGNLIEVIGKPSYDKENEELLLSRIPNNLKLITGKNVIAVRYSNHNTEEFISGETFSGFYFFLTIDYYDYLVDIIDNWQETSIIKVFFVTFPSVLAILHIALFFFNPKKKDNLYYVAFLVLFALYMYTAFRFELQANPLWEMYKARFVPALMILSILLGLTTIIKNFKEIPRWYFVFPVAAILIAVYGYFYRNNYLMIAIYIYLPILFAVTGNAVFHPWNHKGTNSTIIKIGFSIMAASGIYQMFIALGLVPSISGFYPIYFIGVVIFIISMSVALAYDFVQTNKRLAAKLIEVQELTDKTIKQELDKKLLEADNERKTKELEEARKLQLSMLPDKLPDTDYYSLAAYMKTATEVGGDYYDYTISNGSLNIVVGDATGHGTKAGIMVSTMKSLFVGDSGTSSIPDFFGKCSSIIKQMNLGNLFMSLMLWRFGKDTAVFASAGMPQVLVYKKNSGSVDELLVKSMPLGAALSFPYEENEINITSGDTLLLMSDGITELFDKNKKLLGLDRIKKVFEENAELNPQEIINIINSLIYRWAGEGPYNDDITLMVIKRK